MSVTSVNEAYYLVRIGSWSEEDLERWVQKRISDKVDEVSTEYCTTHVLWKKKQPGEIEKNTVLWIVTANTGASGTNGLVL